MPQLASGEILWRLLVQWESTWWSSRLGLPPATSDVHRVSRQSRNHEPPGGPCEWRRASTIALATLNRHPVFFLAAVGDPAVPADPNGFAGESRLEELEPFGRPAADDDQETLRVRHPIRSPFQPSTIVRAKRLLGAIGSPPRATCSRQPSASRRPTHERATALAVPVQRVSAPCYRSNPCASGATPTVPIVLDMRRPRISGTEAQEGLSRSIGDPAWRSAQCGKVPHQHENGLPDG
jgi:hypothetical protein